MSDHPNNSKVRGAGGESSSGNGRNGKHPERCDADGAAQTVNNDVEQAVEAINAEIRKENRSRLKVGEIVENVVAAAGGTRYGEQTIAALARDPDLECSGEHLRKCWHSFLLQRDYGTKLDSEFPKLKFGHRYELSRFLMIDNGDIRGTAILAMAKHAMDNGKGGEPMAADALARAVSTHLKSLKNGGNPAVPTDPDGQGEENDGKTDGGDDLDDLYIAMTDGIAAVQEAASMIAESGEYHHAAQLQANVESIAQAHIRILAHIVEHDPDNDILVVARKRVTKLAEILGLKVGEAA